MPRYFLNILDGIELINDPDGEEFEDLAAAEQEALQGARDLMAECLRAGAPLGLGREMVIADEDDTVVATVPFASAIPPEASG
jgi:hypothetical protein